MRRVIALTVLLVLVAYPAITLSEELTQTVAINIYRDGSVSAALEAVMTAPQITTTTPVQAGYAELTITLDLGSRVVLGANYTLLGAFPSGTQVPQLTLVLSGKMGVLDNKTANIVAELYFDMSYYEGNKLVINATNLTVTFNKETLLNTYAGEVKVLGLGEAAQIATYLPTIINVLQVSLKKSEYADIVEVKRLGAGIENNVTTVYFEVDLDYGRLLTKLYPEEVVRSIREHLANTTLYPGEFYFELNVVDHKIAGELRIVSEIEANKFIERLVESLEIVGKQLNATLTPPYLITPEQAQTTTYNATRLLLALEDTARSFFENFEVKPSTSIIRVTVIGNKVEVYVTTPRIVKKGATSPSDTIRALYNYALNTTTALEELGVKMEIRKLMETQISLNTEPGVRVKLNGTEVTSVKFENLDEIEVEVEKPVEVPPTLVFSVVAATVVIVTTLFLVLRRVRRET